LGRRLGYRASDWLPDAVTAVSRAVAEAHVAAAMVDPSKLSVLPNGVDVQTWRPDAAHRAATRRELGIGDGFLWFAAGRLEPVKDYPTLLAALARLPNSATLAIAGAGWLLDELQQLSVDLGVQERVRFLGFEADLRHWMQAADGFVLSSRWEGLPMGLLEAAACALPSVATDVPGTNEVIGPSQSPGQTGWLVPAADAFALQTAMTAVMQTSPEERYAIGERARQRVIANFSLEAVLDRWEALYTGLLQEHATPRRCHGTG
jgi:glycosyltransferase involved in cell wall biosynthesis